ncbi:c-type cytochrome [Parapusillimonas sp. JC17]|uniref:c-type cytochrome n=1 Tax=Parapusillimonas sp. JC17 TaxID=3445768 RepID=UPI003F9F39B0
MDRLKRKIQAQSREMPEPYEGSRPIPLIVVLIVAAVFLWAVGYIGYTYQAHPASYGDWRSAADFQSQRGAALADGAQLYATHCLACHQATGKGLPGVFPPLSGSEWLAGQPDVGIQIVLHGVTGPLTVGGTQYNGQMPTFKDKLNDEEIAALLTHIRSSFGNAAGEVAARDVATARQASLDRSAPWNGDAELAGLR